jgi:hypothetical protein
VLLCRFHHRAVHEGGLKVQRCDDGAWRFTRPNGEFVDGCAPGHTRPFTDWTMVPTQNAEHGLDITARTGASRWAGDHPDYGMAIDSMLYRMRKAAAAERPSE